MRIHRASLRLFSVATFATAAIVLSSCRDHTTTISNEQSAAASSTSIADAATSDLDAALDASDADAIAPFDAGPLKPAIKISDAGKWLTAHGATISPMDNFGSVWGCEELVVGTAREAALICTEVKNVSRGNPANPASETYRMIEHRIARVVRAGRIVRVLDAEVTLEPLDKEMPTQKNLLDLRLHIAPDGMSATIDDRAAGVGCPPASYLADPSSCKKGDAWTRFDCEAVVRMCNARGGYAWQSDRFVRESP